jgi:chromosomal replication initiator protein
MNGTPSPECHLALTRTRNSKPAGGPVGLADEGNQQLDRALNSAQKQWQATLGELQLQMTRATFDTWLRGSQVVAFEEDTFTVYVRHAYAVDWLHNRLLPVITRTLQRHAGPDANVVFTARAPDREEHLVLVPETVPEEDLAPQAGESARTNGRPSSSLNPRYTFDTFVVGASNRLAHAASLAVTENPAHAYNPLFIYGGVGLGKTHLLHALGHEAKQRGKSVLYVSSEWFTNDLINAIRAQTTEEFRLKYRNTDVLLVDDIQFIAGKERTQEEFFHTFNTLHGSGKQIVVSCDRPPKALATLEDRLRSRFGWGLIADVQPPDFETRMAILSAKAEECATEVSDAVLAYIARKIPSNIRELEGALNRVVAYANLMQVPLNLETAQTALESILAHAADLSPELIVSTVAAHFDLTEADLIGRSRRRQVSVPRQLVMYLIREETGASLPQIGQILGGRDHTTIMHGCKKVGSQIETDDQLRRHWLAIKQTLAQSTNSQ